MEVYAAQLDSMDQGIGRIVAELKAHGQFDNTLILYLQDNGACAEGTRPRQQRPPPAPTNRPSHRWASGRATVRQPAEADPRRVRPVRQGIGVLPGGPDTYIAYGRGWANVSNTPFREYKHWTHEGGIATPLIAHWPAGIATGRKGKLETQPGQLVDIMATCVDLAGTAYPGTLGGETIQPMEGTSLRPAFRGEPLQRTRPLVWEHEGNRAIRDGRWKLVAKENQPWELYDLDADRSESHNLAAQHPDRVQTMASDWDTWAARAHVLPLGAWRGTTK
jgi:arylsulfatase A-like enzyme